MEYYERYFYRYLSADKKTRDASREHWQRCHIENMNSGNDALILFSGKMLGSILRAEKYLNDYINKAN